MIVYLHIDPEDSGESFELPTYGNTRAFAMNALSHPDYHIQDWYVEFKPRHYILAARNAQFSDPAIQKYINARRNP